jgi:hypothetical protein
MQLRPMGKGYKSPIRLLLLVFLAVTLAQSCSSGIDDVDIDDIDLELDVKSLDQAMYQASQDMRGATQIDSLAIYNKHFAGFRDFLVEWMYYGQDSGVTDTMLARMMIGFSGDPYGQSLLDTIQVKLYAQGFDPSAMLIAPFKRYQFYFPERKIPSIVTFADGFPPTAQAGTEQLVATPHFLGIGVHYLLGSHFGYYPPDLPVYIRRRFTPEHLPSLVVHRLADAVVPQPRLEDNPVLLDYIIREGLKMHFVDKILGPTVHDSLKLYYDAVQLDWATFYEGKSYLDLMEHLYDIDYELVRRYVEDSPFTSQLNRKSAPRLGQFLGWKIVRSYVEKHPEEELDALVQRTDYQKIYKDARYRPPKPE